MSSVMDTPPPRTCQHSSHPAHELRLVQVGGAQFTCDGCKQGGQEDRRYRCQPCDFDLHIQCALAPPVFPHPMFGGRKFTLFSGMSNRFCDACGDAVGGTVYHDSQENLDLHPCCAFLKNSIGHPGRVFQLRSKAAASCMLCGQNGPRGNFWSYVLYANGGIENIHVACMLYADHNKTAAAAGAGRSRSTSSPQITANPTSSHQMAGYPNFSHQISSPKMTGYPASNPQMTGYPTSSPQISSPQMTGYPTSSPQMTGYPPYSQMTTGNRPTSSQMMTGNPTSSPQLTGNRPTSSQMMTGTSFLGVMEKINAPIEIANNSLQLAHTVTSWVAEEDEEEDDDDDYE